MSKTGDLVKHEDDLAKNGRLESAISLTDSLTEALSLKTPPPFFASRLREQFRLFTRSIHSITAKLTSQVVTDN
jgi:hypothetical protein